MSQERAEEIFRSIDDDGSNEIDKVEFVNFFSLKDNEEMCRVLSKGSFETAAGS